jgi:hypothetical protein
MAFAVYGTTALSLIEERRGWALRNLPGHLFAGTLWWATALVGWWRHRDQGTWVHTPHTRALAAPAVAAEIAAGLDYAPATQVRP